MDVPTTNQNYYKACIAWVYSQTSTYPNNPNFVQLSCDNPSLDITDTNYITVNNWSTSCSQPAFTDLQSLTLTYVNAAFNAFQTINLSSGNNFKLINSCNIKSTTLGTNLTMMDSFVFPGSKAIGVISMYVNCYCDTSVTFTIRLFDVTSSQVIGLLTGNTNTVPTLVQLNPTGNMSTIDSTWEIQMKVTSGTGNAYYSNTSIEFV
jgi:hypothetical protein